MEVKGTDVNYTMRFIQTDGAPVTIESIATGLRESDGRYRLDDGKLTLGDSTCAEIDLLSNGDPKFDSAIDELRGAATASNGRNKKRVLRTLDDATSVVNVNVLWEECEPEQTLEKIDPLWAHLFDEHEGLVYADDEGFYERSKRILAIGEN
jgi:hypothetical protein